MPTIKKIKLEKLIIDGGTDVRSEIREETVNEYGEAAHAKAKFPPLIVFETTEGLLLADGFHRYFGFERQGIKEYDCDLRKGTRLDAIKFALGCNTEHGLRRSNADKRTAAVIALESFPKLSNRTIAEMCSVSHEFISNIREELEEKTERGQMIEADQVATVATSNDVTHSKSKVPPPPAKREGKDGKTYSVPPRPPAEPAKSCTMDATGIQVPEEITDYWDATLAESQRLLTLVSEVRVRVKRAQDTNEPAFREVDHVDILAKLDQIYVDLKRAKPYAVCPDCNGTQTKGCGTCKGRGFVSEFFWSHAVPSEKKKVTGRV